MRKSKRPEGVFPMFPPTKLVLSFSAALVFALVGCASENPHDVPGNARLVAEGTGRLAYQAPTHGMIYIYDDAHHQMIYSGNVERNQTVSIDPDRNRIMLDGAVASERNIARGDRHRVYFDREPRVGAEHRVTTYEEHRIEERR
jgi:hypothetical protein